MAVDLSKPGKAKTEVVTLEEINKKLDMMSEVEKSILLGIMDLNNSLCSSFGRLNGEIYRGFFSIGGYGAQNVRSVSDSIRDMQYRDSSELHYNHCNYHNIKST